MKIYGLTGMSGAGKTTVCEVFAKSGFYVINCDVIAREVVMPGRPCLALIAKRLGDDLLAEDGSLDRRKTAQRVFGDEQKLAVLNSTIYPYITYEVIKKAENAEAEFILLDAPTLFESGIDFICDEIISVVCDYEKSVERIMKRDGIDRTMAQARLSGQHGREFYESRSDYCIENNGGIDALMSCARSVADKIITEINEKK